MNIILLMSDTFRWDNLGERAAMPVRTPHLDAFARRAVAVEGAYVASFPTIPQRTDMTTGRYGWPWYGWRALGADQPNRMPRLLRQAGYATQLICDCPHLFNAGFQFDFDAQVALRGQEGDLPMLRLNDPIDNVQPVDKNRHSFHFQGHTLADLHRWGNRYWRFETETFPPRTAEMAVRFLEENHRHHPFFLWVDWFDPHEPWDPPEYLVRRYDPDYGGTPMIHCNYGHASDFTPEELRNLRAHYCAEAELVDRWVGRVLDKLDDLQLWDNTIVVFTSDHGTALGEHDRTGKTNINRHDQRRCPLYPEIARVPLLIAAPGLAGGRSVTTLVQPPDYLPTLLDLAGVAAAPPEPFHGQSFADLLRGASAAPIHEFVVAASHCARLVEPDGTWQTNATTPMLYTREWAYAPVGEGAARELYDLGADPGCTRNLAADRPDVCDRLHAMFLDWLRELNAPEHNLRAFAR